MKVHGHTRKWCKNGILRRSFFVFFWLIWGVNEWLSGQAFRDRKGGIIRGSQWGAWKVCVQGSKGTFINGLCKIMVLILFYNGFRPKFSISISIIIVFNFSLYWITFDFNIFFNVVYIKMLLKNNFPPNAAPGNCCCCLLLSGIVFTSTRP